MTRTPSASGVCFAFGRYDKINDLAHLRRETKHANRAPGAVFETRPGTTIADQQRWVCDGAPSEFDLVRCFKAKKAELGARERKGGAIAIHVQLGVSPEWIEQGGGLHEIGNERNHALFDAVTNFCASYALNAFALRLDLDEVGGAIVDAYCAPASHRSGRKKKDGTHGDGVSEFSVNKALTGLRKKFSEKSDGAALQSAWSRFAQEHLDPALQRGRRKSETGRVHLETPDYKRVMEELKAQREALEQVTDELNRSRTERDLARKESADLAGQRADLDEERARVARCAGVVDEQMAQLEIEKSDWCAKQAVFEAEQAALEKRRALWADEERARREDVSRVEDEAKQALTKAEDLKAHFANMLEGLERGIKRLTTYVVLRLRGEAVAKLEGTPDSVKSALAAFDAALDAQKADIEELEAHISQELEIIEAKTKKIAEIDAAILPAIKTLRENYPNNRLLGELLAITGLAKEVLPRRGPERDDGRGR